MNNFINQSNMHSHLKKDITDFTSKDKLKSNQLYLNSEDKAGNVGGIVDNASLKTLNETAKNSIIDSKDIK